MRCYLVGGAVRDGLLGRAPADRDWLVLDETHESLVALGFKPVGQSFTTYLHPRSGEQYSLPRGAAGERASEHERVIADLSERDLTINALAISPEDQLVDPFGGKHDAAAGVLRHVSNAFADDPVRIMRVARLAAELGFVVAPNTASLCQALCASGCFLPAHQHRLFTEFVRGAYGPHPAAFIDALEVTGTRGWLQGVSQAHSPSPSAPVNDALNLTLRTAHHNGISEPGLFAALSFSLGTQSVCEKLSPTTACLRTAQWLARHHRACSNPREVPADALVALFEDTRARRDTTNLNYVIEATAAIAGRKSDDYACVMWRNIIAAALAAARDVKSSDFTSTQAGPQLGAVLLKARAQAIKKAIGR